MGDLTERLKRCGWTDTQAQALAELIGDGLPWGEDGKSSTWRQTKLHDWCSANSKQDPTSLEGQLAFLTADLRNNMGKLYSAASDTHEHVRSLYEIRRAFKPYFDRLAEGGGS